MSTSLSKLVDNLPEIYSKNCRDKNFKGLKNNKLSYNCKGCRKKKLKPINGLFKKFPNNGINRFILLLRKGPYSSERFNETILPNKKAFYNKLYLEDITDEDYLHAQKVFGEFKLKNRGEYYDLYVQSNTLLLADVSENFRKKCLQI